MQHGGAQVGGARGGHTWGAADPSAQLTTLGSGASGFGVTKELANVWYY